MKKLILLILLTSIAATSFGQGDWQTNFDPPYFHQYYSTRFYVDTASNPNCKWQVGHPTKTVFVSAHSNPNALVTDTLNALPANDTSYIYIKHFRDWQPFHVFRLHFWFQTNGDSTDRGIIEVSPDSGQAWINILTEDTTYHFGWMSAKPTLSGSTGSWQTFDLDMMEWGSAFQGWGGAPFPLYITSDTVLFRFTYITDSNAFARDGWMIDDLSFEDWSEGIEEMQNDNLISIYPNPTDENLFIHKTKNTDKQFVQIFDCTGQLLFEDKDFRGVTIDTKKLQDGIYLLKYFDMKSYLMKKLVVQH